MQKLRYNRVFKNGIIALLIGLILFGTIFVLSLISKIQYNRLVSDMLPTDATVVDVDLIIHYKGPNEQEIYIEYEVDGVTYSRELKTDTQISFSAGRGTNYSVGDKIDILYDPQNPEIIAAPRSAATANFVLVFVIVSLVFFAAILMYMFKHSREFLVTQEQYEKEGEERKKNKLAEKERKKQKKLARRIKNAKSRKVIKIILAVLGALVGAFVLFLLWGALLKALGY